MWTVLKPLILPSGKRLAKGATLKPGLLDEAAISHLLDEGVLKGPDPTAPEPPVKAPRPARRGLLTELPETTPTTEETADGAVA